MNSSSEPKSAFAQPKRQGEVTAEQYREMGIADTIRYRSAFARPVDPNTGAPAMQGGDDVLYNENRTGDGGGGLPTFFNRIDLIFFAIIVIAFGVLLKFQYKVDVTPVIWNFVKPHYDDGVHDYWSWDGESKQQKPSVIDDL